MERRPLNLLEINLISLGTGNALHCSNNVNTMRRLTKMETTQKIIRIEGLAGLALEALRAIRRLEMSWAMHHAMHHVGCMISPELDVVRDRMHD